jgi:hypothetical protein
VSEQLKAQREQQGVIVPAAKVGALAGNSPVSAYLSQHAVSTPGTFIKFAKDGVYRKQKDDAAIPTGTEAVVVYDQIRFGWIRFNGRGQQPERKMGVVFTGYVPEARESLGDNEPKSWEIGLSGKPTDPWQFQVLVPMQDTKTGELYIFGTTSLTGRNACDDLIAKCARMLTMEPEFYPVVKLDVSGFQHRDDRIGWVKTPTFPRIGKAPKADTSAATTSLDEQLNDEIPW